MLPAVDLDDEQEIRAAPREGVVMKKIDNQSLQFIGCNERSATMFPLRSHVPRTKKKDGIDG